MSIRASSNGTGFKTALMAKDDVLPFALKLLNLHDCSVLDLDNPLQLNSLPQAQLGLWLDSWHILVSSLGTQDDANEGIELARDMLFLASCRLENMLFSADSTKPPLDQFGKGIQMLFEASTCYTSVIKVATYHGRDVFWGSKPSLQWKDSTFTWSTIRQARHGGSPGASELVL